MRNLLVRAVLTAAVAVAALAMVLVGVGGAQAHSRLESSTPSNGASVATSPASVTLVFNEPIQEAFAVLNVVGPDGNYWQQGDPTVSGKQISVPLRTLGPTGAYEINYRITSADGHPVDGKRTFTLTVAGTGTPGPKVEARESSDSGLPVWPFIVIGVLVLAGGVGVVGWMSRSRPSV